MTDSDHDGLLLESMEEAVDYGDMRLAQACAYSAVGCSFVDPRSAINDSGSGSGSGSGSVPIRQQKNIHF